MIEYIKKIKIGFRDIYKFIPNNPESLEPNFDNIPDGEYSMSIDNKQDNIIIKNNRISCCNFKD